MIGELDDTEAIPCPACPDGGEWLPDGPTGRACRVCGGHALVNRDGSPLQPLKPTRNITDQPKEMDDGA